MIQFVRDRLLPSKPAQLLIQTGLKWQRDRCAAWGAALSYYALFSLFPILLVTLSILSQVLGSDNELMQQLSTLELNWLPSAAREIVDNTVIALKRSSTGAGIIGFALLLYSASTVFGVLNQAVDAIWNADLARATAIPLRQTVIRYVVNRAIAFLLVFSTCLLLLASLLSQIWVEGVVRFVDSFQWRLPWLDINQIPLADGLDYGLSMATIACSTLFLLKMLPSARTAWRDIWPGALLTAALFFLLQWLVTNSIVSMGSRYASYGVIGGVMILLLWIYFTCQIFFLGCEFSYVYAYLFGTRRHSLGKNSQYE